MNNTICHRCGEARSKHALMNPHVYFGGSGEPALLLCPTALFLEQSGHVHACKPSAMFERCECGMARHRTGINADGPWSEWEMP